MSSTKTGWDRFHKVRELGRGATGVVYLCADTAKTSETEPDYYVAVKCVNLMGATEAERSAALRETALLRNLSHPNIIRCIDCFVDNNEMLCTVMEYVDGGDLSDMIEKCHGHHHHHSQSSKKKGQTPKKKTNKKKTSMSSAAADDESFSLNNNNCDDDDEAAENNDFADRFFIDAIVIVDIAEQVLKALAFLHQNNIVHRDIKPHNILVNTDGIVKLADFGVARVISKSMSGAKSFVGTPFYLSPEVAMGMRCGFAADMWAFSVCMYEVYTGDVPFNAGNVLALVFLITEGKYDEEKLLRRPYRSVGRLRIAGDNNNAAAAATSSSSSPLAAALRPEQQQQLDSSASISKQVQDEVRDAVCNIIRAGLVQAPQERPTAREMLLRYFTEDPYAGEALPHVPGEGTAATSSTSPDRPLSSQQQQHDIPPLAPISPALIAAVRRSGGSSSAAAQDEVAAVVRSSYAGSLALDCATEHVSLSESQLSRAPSQLQARRQEQPDGLHHQQSPSPEYDDDFDDDILSASKQERPPANPVLATRKAATASSSNNNDDDMSSTSKNNNLENTRDVAERIEQLPWLLEPELFENMQIDSVNGHGPMFLVRTPTSVSAASNQQQHQQLPSSARLQDDVGEKHVDHAVANQHQKLQHHHQQYALQSNNVGGGAVQQVRHNFRYMQQHRGSHSGLVCEVVTPSRRGGAGSSSSNTPSSSLSAFLSLPSHRDPGSSSTAAAGPIPIAQQEQFLKQLQQQQQQQEQASSGSPSSPIPTRPAQQVLAPGSASARGPAPVSEDDYQQLQQRIRERALIFHKKRLASLVKEREAELKEKQEQRPHQPSQQPQQNPQQEANNNSRPDPLSATLLGQHRTSLDDLRLQVKQQQQQHLQREAENFKRDLQQRRPSAVLNDIVDARARGVISNALLSAFPHLMKKQPPASAVPSSGRPPLATNRKPSPKKQTKPPSDDDDDEEEEEESALVEEEEEEEESELDDDEFRVTISFSESVATALKAVPFTGKTASAMEPPSTFKAFTIKARLYEDAGYSKLLKAVQDQVVFFGGGENFNNTGCSNVNNNASTTASLTNTKTKKKQRRSGGGGSSALENTRLLSAVVPLSFEFKDSANGGEKIVFSRRSDWNCIRDMFLDQCDNINEEAMELNAVPRVED